MDVDETMDLPAVAAFLKVKPDTVAQYARSGELAGAQIGKAWIFLLEDVLAFLRQRIAEETAARRAAHATAHAAAALMGPQEGALQAQAVVLAHRPRTRRTLLPVLPSPPGTGPGSP